MNTGIFNGMFGKVAPGMCRLSMAGKVAVKTDSGYKSYDIKTGRLTNCDNFVFDIGEEFFFIIPTNKVKKGDIILVSGKPKCVIEVKKEAISVINYEDSTLEQIIPERHVFMGNTYFYGKIVSMFGDSLKAKGGMNKMMKYMMMSEMMKGMNGSGSTGGMNAMLPFMLMGGNGFEDMFSGFMDDDVFDDEEVEEKEE